MFPEHSCFSCVLENKGDLLKLTSLIKQNFFYHWAEGQKKYVWENKNSEAKFNDQMYPEVNVRKSF